MNQSQKLFAAISAAAAAAYVYVIFPRVFHRPDRSFLMGRH